MLKVTPLGGLGEVGMNAMLFESRGRRLLVDCGVMFPRGDLPGVDVVLPDFGPLTSDPERLDGVVLTHAHEDHLGALPWLLREVRAPVWGTPYALAVARNRLEEAGVKADLRELAPRERFAVGEAFDIEPVRVTHSVPDAVGLVVRTAAGTVVHTGDFKLDESPIDGRCTDLERLGEIGDEGVLALLSDSTNAEVPGRTGSERLVADTFGRLLAAAPGRVVIALFGSHLHRVRHVAELARRLGRRVLLRGRSLVRNVELAQSVGALEAFSDVLVDEGAAARLEPRRLVVLCTGAQAEPRSGLATLLSADDGPLRLGATDTIILSSRTIPGNEPQVTELVNRLLERGVRVIHPGIEPGVHVSGHAARDEQRHLLERVRPRHLVPIHGELRHLHAHLSLAEGFPTTRGLLLTDGDQVGFDAGGATRLGRLPARRQLLRRTQDGPVDAQALVERRALAQVGVVTAVLVLERGGTRLLRGPTLRAAGFSDWERAVLPLIAEAAAVDLKSLTAAQRADDTAMESALTSAVRRASRQLIGLKPVVLPVILREQAPLTP